MPRVLTYLPGFSLVMATALALSGCQLTSRLNLPELSSVRLPGVYRIDLPQGTPLTQAQAQQVQPGMSQDQVRYLLGTPAIQDPLQPMVWDYVYHYEPGTYARKAGLKSVKGQLLRIRFDQGGRVTQVEGLNSIPADQPGLPASRDARLNATPL